jgi:hypothetical protein
VLLPSSPDDWLGGVGNWSNGAGWSTGLPGSNSDVLINTGNDTVTLDTSASINSLTLGGSSGSSILASDANPHTLLIAGALTINQSGNLQLYAGSVSSGANSTNLGNIDLENASTLQVSGNLSNSGMVCLACTTTAELTSTVVVSGSLSNAGSLNLGNVIPFSLGSGSVTVRTLVNSGSIDLDYGSLLHVNGDMNNSGFIGSQRCVEPPNCSYVHSVVEVAGSLTNTGSISIYGEVQVNGNALNSGQISTAFDLDTAGDSVIVNGTLTNTQTGVLGLYGVGSVASLGSLVNNGMVALQNGSWLQAGDVTNSGQIISTSPDQVIYGNRLSIGTLTNNAGALFDVSGREDEASIANLINRGTVLVGGFSAGVQIGSMVNSGLVDVEHESTLHVTGDVTNSGQIATALYDPNGLANIINIDGSLTNDQGASFILHTQYDSANIGSIVNSGQIDLENQSSLRVNGNVTNSGQITTSYYGNGYATGNTIQIAGKLTNNAGGTFSLGAASDLANIGHITNAGTVSIAGGAALSVGGAGSTVPASALPGFANTGIVNIAHGGTLSSGLTYFQTGGQTTVDGNLRVLIVNFAGGSVYGNQGTIQGPITSNAAINIGDSPMTVGELSFVGNYTQGANGSLTFDIAGASLGQYDQLNVSGRAQLNGLMTVDLLHGFVPQIGNSFDIMNFASESGTFSMVVGLPINGQEHFVLDYNSTNLTLDVVTGQLSGSDAQGDSASLFANEPFMTQTDGNGYSLGAANNGGASPTPEPSSILLLGTGLAGLAVVLRRRR